jgi:ornithine decarboxylase
MCITDSYIPIPDLPDKQTKKYKTTFYGPTCDGLDKIIEMDAYPEMTLNDWVLFQNMGAYTLAGACNFNGIPFLNTHIVYLRLKTDLPQS